MTKITLFTNKFSRGINVKWLLEELEIPYEEKFLEFGAEMKIPEYQVRYHKNYVHQTIKEYIADLHLERFATKEDLQNVRLEMKNMKHQLLMWQIGIGVTIMSANFAMLKFMLH